MAFAPSPDRQAHSSPSPLPPRVLLSTSSWRHSPSPDARVSRRRVLPGEGRFYDAITVRNFVDLAHRSLTASLRKSFHSDALSAVAGADFPARLTVSAKLGNASHAGASFDPAAKLALSVRLLDLGSADGRQRGYLRFKAATRSCRRSDHGFEIDRKLCVWHLTDTAVYGNVRYGTDSAWKGVWKTVSSFGLHQTLRFAGVTVGVSVGMTPEGAVVTDITF